MEFLFGFVFAAVGVGVGVVAGVLTFRSRRIRREWRRATGVVVESDFGSQQSPARNATATFEFQDDAGEARRSMRQGYRPIGTRLPILFDPKRPCDTRLDTWNDLWFVPVILGVLGMIVVVCGLCVMIGLVQVNS